MPPNFLTLTPSIELPLYAKRIIITAPRNYALRLYREIVQQGGLPLLMPTIETCLLTDNTELDRVLHKIEEFDWIVFTSRNGIEAFLERMRVLGLSLSVLESCFVCAIGKDTDKLTDLGIKVNLVPREPSPAGIIAELANFAEDIRGKSILVPAPEVMDVPEPDIIPNFVCELQQLDMKVTRVPTYTTRCLDGTIYEVELELIRQGKIDAIAFSSTAEIESFLNMIDSSDDLQQTLVACFGPYTATNAKKLGLDVAIVAEDYSSFEGFAEAIAAFWATS
ncbi:uroporphyrinogen-III synthase [Pleurocapsales cyanobacterium LEGE 06147]|nr:uroporphyrinogen-III synthase [Pleurocapsales cyanobacterium LEGE 06147]